MSESAQKKEKRDLEEMCVLEADRRTLLQSFESKSTSHGGIIIALLVGLLAMFAMSPTFFTHNSIGDWQKSIDLRVFFYSITYVVLSSLVYKISRMIFWSFMAHTILHLTKKEIDECVIEYVASHRREVKGVEELPAVAKMHYAAMHVIEKKRMEYIERRYSGRLNLQGHVRLLMSRLYIKMLNIYKASNWKSILASLLLGTLPLLPIALYVEGMEVPFLVAAFAQTLGAFFVISDSVA